ncbi:signal recognition particle-docking protein FtsY [Limosilactobacillus secaliphilus]|uniref:Signal recognition particle receptor FtsY n=1 Tax=Limosilactobacillus secaliphilus TaxID=396268 RepID=A0A0R2I1N5_9LACO|nr:signal recognition particle-docking protein FtsY [Limosilactobacillus secaliphilus]KRN59091.1 signal recognition particle-docking protein FtsY [Limosilactobacillus secaliphilus]
MGLFDIFRRKKKSEAASSASEKPVESTESQAASSVTSAESASVAQPAESTASETTSSSAAVSQSASSSSVASASTEPEASASASQADTSEANSAAESTATESANSENNEASSAAQAESAAASEESAVSAEASESAESTSEADEAEAASVAANSEAPTSSSAKSEEAQQSEEPKQTEEERYDRGLEKSRTGFGARLNRFLANFRHVDEDFFDDLEDLMIESDVGYDMAMKLSDSLQEEVKLQNAKSKQEVSNVIIEKMVSLYEEAGNGENNEINYAKSGPTVIMFVGVNGAGKTTTIGKLAARYKRQGKKVLLAAADTFRAGAVEQLDVWAKRDGVDIVTGPENGDPAAVVFDGVKKAKAENYDFLLVDTAGRLQNKVNLMNELAKMKRILSREIPDAPHEVLLVLDATTGQNALTQAKMFKESTDVTGIVLTKLDGTARGGIVLAIRNELHLPVKLVGLGEHVDDLADFDASEFVYGLFKGLVNE